MKTILYIHGMGGGGDSRIPCHLQRLFGSEIRVVIRTYDFDPEIGRAQILSWVDEVHPDLVIGESLGAIQAIRIQGIPHILVSPAMGAPEVLYRAVPVSRFAIGRWIMHKMFPVKEGDRQPLKFFPEVLRKYREHGQAAIRAIEPDGYYFAFFGTQDHYMRSGVVKPDEWEKLFGKGTSAFYEGSHFMEAEFIESMLLPKIREVLSFKKNV